MNSHLSSFSEQNNASDFDENIPFKVQEANFDAITETEKEFDSDMISVINYNKIQNSDRKGQRIKNEEVHESYNVSSDTRQGLKHVQKDIKPFTYKPDGNKYFENTTKSYLNSFERSINKGKFLQVREEGEGIIPNADS
jgi:hypothetical protein